MTIKKFLIAVALAAGMATGASAATLSGNSSGVFTSEDGTNVSASGNQLTWPGIAIINPQSTLTIDNYAFNIPAVPLGNTSQKIGQLTWFNASSLQTFSANFNAQATLTLDYDSPLNTAGTEVSIPRACGHRFHEHVATDSTMMWPPVPRHVATPLR